MKTQVSQPKQIAKYFSLPKKIRKPFQVRDESVWIGTRPEILKHFNGLKRPLGASPKKSDTSPREIPGLSMRSQLENGYKAGGGLYRVFFIVEDRQPPKKKNELPHVTICFVSQIVDIQPMWKRRKIG